MVPKSFWRSVAVPVFLLLWSAGCLKRAEHIAIHRDGSVTIRAGFETDTGEQARHELYGGDVPPSAEAGWKIIEQKPVTDEQGKTKYVLTAEWTSGAGEKLPSSFARPGDPNADLYLKFPTELRREKRADGEYFHFSRRYPRRRFDELEYYRQTLVTQPTREIEEKKGSDLTREDRIKLIKGAVELEIMKFIAFARDAFYTITPDAPQDAWLAVWQALKSVEDQVDVSRLFALMEKHAKEDDRGEVFEAEVQALKTKVRQRLESALLSRAGYTPPQRQAFLRHYQHNQRYFEITEDLRDESFEITVGMPGEIVAANTTHRERNTVKWEFSGEALANVSVELRVTSRIAD